MPQIEITFPSAARDGFELRAATLSVLVDRIDGVSVERVEACRVWLNAESGDLSTLYALKRAVSEAGLPLNFTKVAVEGEHPIAW